MAKQRTKQSKQKTAVRRRVTSGSSVAPTMAKPAQSTVTADAIRIFGFDPHLIYQDSSRTITTSTILLIVIGLLAWKW